MVALVRSLLQIAFTIHPGQRGTCNLVHVVRRYNIRRSVDALSIDFSNAPVPPTSDVARPHHCCWWMDGWYCLSKKNKNTHGLKFCVDSFYANMFLFLSADQWSLPPLRRVLPLASPSPPYTTRRTRRRVHSKGLSHALEQEQKCKED